MTTGTSRVTEWWTRYKAEWTKPIDVDWTWIKSIAKFIPLVFCIGAVYGCGIMVGIVQHKTVICYSFSAWFFGVMGIAYIAWLIFDRITEPIK